MNTDRKTKVIKYLKIMSAYFILYLIHFVIYPNTPLYTNSDNDKFIQGWSLLLFPLFDIFILKSNFGYGCIGIALYDICVFVYSAGGAYDICRLGLFDKGAFSYEALLFHLTALTVLYLVIYLILTIIIFVINWIKNYISSREDKEDKS
ncbi:hypothetical protein SAMN02745115_01574 [[Eubacterium] yurii]|nr:hypothetical protein SAMN02745115_01574 [[Eubacterium] yurii]